MYQDEWVSGATVSAGARSCAERWDMFGPLLPNRGVLLDVGSNLGYYCLRAVAERPGLACVSLEYEAEYAERQRSVLQRNDASRVCLVQGPMSASVAQSWSESCDHFAAVLLLSVLHWVDDPAAVARSLSSMAGMVVVELNDGADEGAGGQQNIAQWGDDPQGWLASTTGRDVRLVGRPQRHTSEAPSWLFVVDGPTERRPQLPYRAAAFSAFRHPEGRDYELRFDGERPSLTIRGRTVDWIDGVNVRNLMQLGKLMWPSRRTWEQAAAAPGAALHPDPGPHNMLWGPDGITLIDADDLAVPHDDAARYVHRGFRMWSTGPVDAEYQRRRRSPVSELSVWMRRTERDNPRWAPVLRPTRHLLATGRRAVHWVRAKATAAR